MIRADIPESNYGANVQVKVPMPRSTVSATTELTGSAPGQVSNASSLLHQQGLRIRCIQTSEYNAAERSVIWSIRKFPGTTEQAIRIKVTVRHHHRNPWLG
jgi:AP-4 complex subunit mu-1